MYINNKMHKILLIKLYFPLDAIHVSDCISPSSGETFYMLYIAFAVARFAGTAVSDPSSSMAIFVFIRCVRAYGLS